MEEIIVANLTLDTYQRNKVAPLVVPQGDYGARVIRAKITDLGKPVIVESTAAVSIVATRSGDGESQAFSGSVNADGTVTVPVTQWMLDVPEEDVTCHIVVTGIGYQYSTTSFLIEPQSKANPTEIAPDDPRQDLVTEVLAGENTRRAAEAERVSNENARIAAENARQSAETQRLTDESTRITNEAQRVSAEASRDATFKRWAQDIASLPTFDGRISANRKRIENLESGIPAESFIIDDSVAYTKDVPENVAPNAVVQKVGGMTYKDGNTLKSAKVTEVKSVGANLFDFETWKATAATERAAVTYGDNSVTVSAIEGDAFIISEAAGVMVKGGETYIISFVESNTDIESVHYLFKNGKVDNSMKIFYSSPYTFVADADAEYYTVRFGVSNAGSTITFSNIKINKGSTAQPYTPYVEHTLPIPEAVRPANGINENVYDYIEWAEDGSVKQTNRCKKIVVDGSVDESWTASTDGLGGFLCPGFNNSSGNIVLSSRYSPRIYPWGEFETIGITKEGTLWICAPRTSIDEWRSQLASNPIEIVYELAEPIVTDISDLITADNLIGVEGGGTLTFENEHKYAVPSTIIYQSR